MDEIVTSPTTEATPRRKARLAPLVSITAGVGVILAVWASGATGTAAADSPTAPTDRGPLVTHSFAGPGSGTGPFTQRLGDGPGPGQGKGSIGIGMVLDPADAAKLSDCMQANGFPSFPEPDADGKIELSSETSDIALDSEEFQAAQQKCQPAPRELSAEEKVTARAEAKKHADCMRAEGITGFPEPDADGRILIQGTPGGELDPMSEQWQAAEEKCRPEGASFSTHGGTDSGTSVQEG